MNPTQEIDKQPQPRARIGHRLVLSFVLLVMIVVGSSGWVLYELTKRSLEWQMREHLVSVARLLSTTELNGDILVLLRPGWESFRVYQNGIDKLKHAKEVIGAARVYAFDTEGRSLLDTGTEFEQPWPIGRDIPHLMIRDRMEVAQVLNGAPTYSVLFYKDGVPYMTGYAPIYSEERVVGAVGVDVGVRFMDSMHVFERSVLVFAALGALITVVVAMVLAQTITRPVQKLVKASREIGRGNLSYEVDASSRDELGYLGETMEEMRRKLVARDAQLRQMLGGVAHEIRNPLGGIEIYAGLIAADLPPSDPRKQHIQQVIQEVRKLNRVISQFLDYARPAPPDREPTSVRRLVEDAFFLLAPETEQAEVRCDYSVPEGLDVYVDAEQVKRALFNLMKNGLQAMRAGGTLTVSARGDGREALIEVRDTGAGMSPDVRERLFEPFFTTKEKGSGLGLAMVARTLDQNGGSIDVESQEGVGTTCLVRLPLHQTDTGEKVAT